MTDPLDREPDAGAPPAATTDAPSDAGPPPAPAGARRRGVSPLQLALATVALLAGAALFLSGFSLGARTATTPGTPAADAELFAPFWDT